MHDSLAGACGRVSVQFQAVAIFLQMTSIVYFN